MSTRHTRRWVLRAGVSTAVTAAVGVAGGRGTDAYGGHLADEDTWDGTTVDARGLERVTVMVGARGNGGHFAFDPPAVLVEPGATVVWIWTGDGGAYDVTHVDGTFKSKISPGAGDTFTHTFEDEGVYPYVSRRRRETGMKGVVVVGVDHVETDLVPYDGLGAKPGPGSPDFGGYLDDVGNFDGVTDRRGEGTVEIAVGVRGNGGHFAFDPPAVRVGPGTTVVWEWTGEGSEHSVAHTSGDFESEVTGEAGHTVTHTFEEDGIYRYACSPHEEFGMKGAVVVGDDYPTVGSADDGTGERASDAETSDESEQDRSQPGTTGEGAENGTADNESENTGEDATEHPEDGATTDEDGPGFGVAGALVGIGTAGYLLANRHDSE